MSYVAPWALVTALAVTLSWLGVRGVVRGATSERSVPRPSAGPVIHASPETPPDIGSPAAKPAPTAKKTKPPASSKPSPTRKPAGPAGDEPLPDNVRSYATRGGRAAMAIAGGKVKLVSATPNPGYETRITPAEGWLRVDFIGAEHTSSVIGTWYDHKPVVRVYEY